MSEEDASKLLNQFVRPQGSGGKRGTGDKPLRARASGWEMECGGSGRAELSTDMENLRLSFSYRSSVTQDG